MNAAYLRLKNLQVGYDLPEGFSKRLGAKASRVYVTGENLWTWSPLYKFADNIDVENATAPSDQFANPGGNSGDANNYPMLKSFNIGMTITFR